MYMKKYTLPLALENRKKKKKKEIKLDFFSDHPHTSSVLHIWAHKLDENKCTVTGTNMKGNNNMYKKNSYTQIQKNNNI